MALPFSFLFNSFSRKSILLGCQVKVPQKVQLLKIDILTVPSNLDLTRFRTQATQNY